MAEVACFLILFISLGLQENKYKGCDEVRLITEDVKEQYNSQMF